MHVQVYQVSVNQVLQQEAYLLFYARDPEYHPPANTASSSSVSQAKGIVIFKNAR